MLIMVEIHSDNLLLILTGAHLKAERDDRPLAYRLRDAVVTWQNRKQAADDLPFRRDALVCSDLWYLNNQELHDLPTIAIGEPGVNAASAFFANRLPEALIIDQALRVQLDQELIDLKVCIWGVDASATASGVDLFIDRYLEEFLCAAHEMPIG